MAKKAKPGFRCSVCGFASSTKQKHHNKMMEPECETCFEAKGNCVCPV